MRCDHAARSSHGLVVNFSLLPIYSSAVIRRGMLGLRVKSARSLNPIVGDQRRWVIAVGEANSPMAMLVSVPVRKLRGCGYIKDVFW